MDASGPHHKREELSLEVCRVRSRGCVLGKGTSERRLEIMLKNDGGRNAAHVVLAASLALSPRAAWCFGKRSRVQSPEPSASQSPLSALTTISHFMTTYVA